MKAAILGWYEHGNIGDEAMLEGLQILLEAHLGCRESKIMSNEDCKVTKRFSSSAANECDLFVLGGGELISEKHIWLFDKDWSKSVTVPKIIMGCGVIGNRLTPSVRKELRDFKYIGLRDRVAYELLSSDRNLRGRTRLAFDPSFVLPSKYGVAWAPDSHVAAVIPTERQTREWDEGVLSTNIIEETKEQLRAELKRDGIVEVRLLAFGSLDNDDFATCMKLAECLKSDFNVTVFRPSTPKEALQLMAESSKAYCYRLHGMLFAYSLGMPFQQFSYHTKIQRNFDTLTQFSLADAMVTMKEAWGDLKVSLETE